MPPIQPVLGSPSTSLLHTSHSRNSSASSAPGNKAIMVFKLNLQWRTPVRSPTFLAKPSSWPSSLSPRSRETLCDSAKLSLDLFISWHSENILNDPLSAHRSSSTLQMLETNYSEIEEIKMNICGMAATEDKSPRLMSSEEGPASHFGLLMENLDMLEASFTDSEVERLESDILVQLERLGALKLFYNCLSRTFQSPTSSDFSDMPAQSSKETLVNDMEDASTGKIFVSSGKKKERKLRRGRACRKASAQALPSKSVTKDFQRSDFSFAKRPSNSKRRRLVIARNEAEMSRGVKLLDNLERIRAALEEETGQVASLSSWAEAARVDEKMLQQHLHFGWHCRDELLRSVRSLVLYLARSYRGLGVALEDLIQAGNCGVLQGAVRFDHTRGYRFSTYVQYWIRKSMSTFVARHSRGIRIPFTLGKAINQIQKARKTLSNCNVKCPGDDEIAKFTGLSLAKISSASKCLRIVGSIDQKIGDCMSAKFMEIIPDTSIKSPEETVTQQHMINDLHDLLKNMDPKEREVLALRFGLVDNQRKSLEEIGRLYLVSKEWIRRIERKALTKLRHEALRRDLSRYLG
ncbi:hypothetical protein NMG60_11000806 [Bertholletia excelsa]